MNSSIRTTYRRHAGIPDRARDAGTQTEWALRYRFGCFELDERRFELRRAGLPVYLQRRPFDLLHYLVGRHGEVVTKRELIESVWSGVHVTEGALPRAIRVVRRALGDDVRAPSFIQTVRCRGYRFAWPVETHRT